MSYNNININNLAGVVVLYFPESNVYENINSYANSLSKLFIIDNTDNESFLLKFNTQKIPNNSEYIKFNENLGIAKALNFAAEKAISEGFFWLLTMDQDSKFEKNTLNMLFFEINKFKSVLDIGIFTPNYKITNKFNSVEKSEALIVITSGNIIQLSNLKRINFFNELLFIDYVDYDICLRFNFEGFRVIIFNNIFFYHSLGDTHNQRNKFLFLNPTNHSALRRYYITRNRLYLLKKYKNIFKDYYSNEIWSIVKEYIKILLLENNKIEKLKMSYLGFLDFKKSRFGKF